MSSPAWHRDNPVWQVTYSGGMEYWWRDTPEVQLIPTVPFLNAVATLVGSSEVTSAASSIFSPVAKLNGDSTISPNGSLLAALRAVLEGDAVLVADTVYGAVRYAVAALLSSSEQSAVSHLLLSPSAYMSGSSEIDARSTLLISPKLVLEGNSVLIVAASTRLAVRAYLLGDGRLIANLAHVTATANTRILSGSLVLLDVLADVHGAYPWAAIRQGRVHPTFAGPVPQYGSVKRPDIIVEVDIPIVNDSQIATIGAMLRGDYGSVFTIEAPRETFQASLIPGNEGVAVEIYPSAPGFTKARAILRFAKVVS